MASTRFLTLSVLSIVLGFGVACGDDDDGGGTDAGGTGDAGGGVDAGDSDGGGGGDASACVMPYVPPTVPVDAACGEADMTAIGMDVYGSGGDLSVAAVAAQCGQMFFTDRAMAEMCFATETMDALSAGCSECYLDSVFCAAGNCLSECLADSNSPACLACRCGKNDDEVDCTGDFEECSGVDSSICDMVCLDE